MLVNICHNLICQYRFLARLIVLRIHTVFIERAIDQNQHTVQIEAYALTAVRSLALNFGELAVKH